jgi:thiosulfate/3-mercaptopyruvate sulfurtransferase
MGSVDAVPDLLVDPDWIAERLTGGSLRPIEVDVSRAAYDSGHIPGALLWDAYRDLRHPDYTPVSRREFEDLLSRGGLTTGTPVVFYGYGAHLGFWLMERCGARDVRIMDGPRERWERAGHAWSTEIPAPAASSFPGGQAGPDLGAARDEVLAGLGGHQHVLLDVRSQAEFDGDRFWPSGATAGAGRAGHVPGAVHLSADEFRRDDGSLREPAELRRVVDAHELDPERPVIVYCTVGIRAAQVAFALTHLVGFPDVRVYYGSWAEWGSRPETPVEVA